jgi:hypothetical protein
MDEREKIEEQRIEEVRNIRVFQVKYIYYVVALNVASLGFTINQIKDDKFNWSHWFLLAAILMWAFGVYNGFIFLDKFKLVLHQWQNYYEFKLDSEKFDSAKINEVRERFNEESINTQLKGESKYKMSLRCFYFGCGIFVIWQSLQLVFFN